MVSAITRSRELRTDKIRPSSWGFGTVSFPRVVPLRILSFGAHCGAASLNLSHDRTAAQFVAM